MAKILSYGCTYTIVLVYGGNDDNHRDTIYNEICIELAAYSHPVLLMGDFNEILNVSERKGQHRITRGMVAFKKWIETLNLIDIPLNGRKFT